MALIPSRSRQAPEAAIIRLQLVVVVHVLLAILCNADQTKDACIQDVDFDSGLARFSYYETSALTPRELQATLLFPGPAFPENGLLTVLRVHVNSSSSELQRCFRFRMSASYSCTLNVPVVNDLDAGDDFNWTSSTADVAAAYIGSASSLYAALGPAAVDVVTLGALKVAERTNVTSLYLPYPPCPGRETRVHFGIFKQLLHSSDIDRDKLTFTELNERTSVFSSHLNLFMSSGLLSLFFTFLLAHPLATVVYHTRCSKMPRRTRFTVYHSALITSILVSGSFLFYLCVNLAAYYCTDTVDDIMFTSTFFSPMTQFLIFYTLSGLTSFIGGVLVVKCTTVKASFNCCECLSTGILSCSVTATIFHSFFLLIGLFEDLLTVLSYLVCLSTVIVILFLSLFAAIEQFKKSRFNGHFPLVVMMEMIVSTMYIISVSSFRQLTNGEDYIATKSFLCIVVVLSLVCISLSVSIIVMVANSGRRPRGAGGSRSGSQQLENDPESPNVSDNNEPVSSDGAVGGGEVQVQQGTQRFVDLTTVAREMGFVVLIPDVVQAWRKRPKSDNITNT